MSPTSRGSFEVDSNGALLPTEANLGALRELWVSRPDGMEPGPGVGPTGAWHVACHLVAAGCVCRAADGQIVWMEMSHVPANDTYAATLTSGSDGQLETMRLDSPEAQQLLENTALLGFVEGTSEGHITARGVQDPPDRFDDWKRQTFDQELGSQERGGRVWEHWCTTRELAPDSELSVSLLTAYLQLCGVGGDLFAPTVARGRTAYGHPAQLNEMINAGFTTRESASWRTTPAPIGRESELLLQEARPADALRAIRLLAWPDDGPTYHMYPRRINETAF
jgi:hypothetical protein